MYSKLNLYRRRWLQASVAVVMACCAVLSASAFQHRNAHKLRATALLELTTGPGGKVSTRLIPITILADGSFQDASIYESRPRPMALGEGVVYEAEKTGVPVGYLTITGASHALEGWIAQGKWQPVTEIEANAARKAQPTPTPTPTDDRPVLHRGSDTGQQPSPQSDQPQPSSSSSGGSNSGSNSNSDDRPILHRSPEQTNQQTSPPADQSAASQSAPPADTQSESDDSGRPVLKRRVPSTAGTPVPSPTPSSTQAGPAQSPPPVTQGTQRFVAVSDAQSTDTRSFEYHWKPGEEEKIQDKMRKLALAQLPGENAQTNEHAMTNVVIRSFDVDLSNDAVVVITAEVPGGYLASGAKGSAAKGTAGKFVSRYITVIARVDIDGNPQKLAASVTDSSRLDVAPRLELIDAVDVDGDGLAELLFREYDFDQKSFIIYGVGHGTVTKVFEGASEPIKRD
jgi:hypothetical protein